MKRMSYRKKQLVRNSYKFELKVTEKLNESKSFIIWMQLLKKRMTAEKRAFKVRNKPFNKYEYENYIGINYICMQINVANNYTSELTIKTRAFLSDFDYRSFERIWNILPEKG
ncbi:MAG: hypothetical protein Q8T08_17215 [Ignavibacteria bacterium]|nr:hypothetical protein [Ignavibacteria bacterium]